MRAREEAEAAAASRARSLGPDRQAQRRRSRAPGPRRTRCAGSRELEERIESAESELRAIEDELADPSAWSSPERSRRSTRRHEAAKAAVAGLYEELEAAEAALEPRARLSRGPAGHLAGMRRSMKLSASSAAENGISAWPTPGYSV